MLPVSDQSSDIADRHWLFLIREIAMDIHPLEHILKTVGIDRKTFDDYSKHPRFQAMLQSEIQAWEAATNTESRVKLKFLSAVEMALPEMYGRLHDAKEPLSAKTELFKALQKGAGIGVAGFEGSAEKVSITINLGDAKPVTVEAVVPTRVIDHDEMEVT